MGMIVTCDGRGVDLKTEDIVWYEGSLCEIVAFDDGGYVFIDEIRDGYMQPLDWVESRNIFKLTYDEYEYQFRKPSEPPAVVPSVIEFSEEAGAAIAKAIAEAAGVPHKLFDDATFQSVTFEITIPVGYNWIPILKSDHPCYKDIHDA